MTTNTNAKNTIPSLTLFFPAYNEEHVIAETIKKAEDTAKKITADYEILIIDDGSTDRTHEIVSQITTHNSKVHLISHPTNLGYGAALMSGFSNATKEWTFFSDGDGQFDLDEVQNLLPYSDNKDVIVGYRKERSDPFMRLINAKGWNLLNKFLFGLSVRDIDCAFKLIKTDTIKPLLPNVTSRGAMISAELLVRLKRAGHSIVEVPVTHYPRTAGNATGAKPRVILRAFREMARVYRGDLGHNWTQNVSRYLLYGIINTSADISIFSLLLLSSSTFASHITWAKGISYICGLILSYLLNQVFVRNTNRLTQIRFILMGIASLAINTGSIYVFYNTVGMNVVISLLLSTVLTFAWNYGVSKVFDL